MNAPRSIVANPARPVFRLRDLLSGDTAGASFPRQRRHFRESGNPLDFCDVKSNVYSRFRGNDARERRGDMMMS